MNSIEEILRKQSQLLKETEGCSNSVIAKDEEMQNYVIRCGERPEPIECEFCHTKLQYRGLIHPFAKNTITRWLSPNECECEESIRHRERERQRLKEEEQKRLEEEALRKKQLEIDRLFNMSKLGERFKKRNFDTFVVNDENKRAYEIANRFVNNFEGARTEGYGIMFSGTCGAGKTHIACSIAIELIKKGIPVIYGTAITLLDKIKETYSENDKSEAELLELYSNVDLLIVDDLGKEKPTEWVVEKLYYIINQRYENLKPTIITSNFDLSKLTERLTVKNNNSTAEAIVSRLCEMCAVVNMNFKDYRRQ